jgi:hypothetical protein
MSTFISLLRESLFRNIGVSHRNLIGLLLGSTASVLLMSSKNLGIGGVTWVFVITLALTMVLLIVVRPSPERKLDRFAWGLLVVIILGFGLGALIYQYRAWWKWIWSQYRRIDTFDEIILESLFLLGVILGVYVVRNWAKEQKAFQDSLAGALGGTFIAAVLGKVEDGLTPMRALAYYALGFTMSGVLNLLFAARLTANYTNKRSITSRAVLDFLYGSERAEIIDGYFLKRFKEDPDFAKARLSDTLHEYQKLVKREFANRMEVRRKSRKEEREKFGDAVRPSYFYQLIAIECDQNDEDGAKADAEGDQKKRLYNVVYKYLGSENAFGEPESFPPSHVLESLPAIDSEMFRVGVALRWHDFIEYIVAPGEFGGSFPSFGSVAGLALNFRQVIIMDRDRLKTFRNHDHPQGFCPDEIEQDRGLDEIDFLSYVSIPIVNPVGPQAERGVGIVNIDTKIFVTPLKLDGEPVKASEGIFRTRLTPRQLTEYANNLYEQDDEDVKYVEELTKIITPVMVLYSKCRVGATVSPV